MRQEPISGIANLEPIGRLRQQKAWYWYDWANSAYVTTVSTVLAAPYLIAVAKGAAVDNRVQLLWWDVAPGAMPAFVVTLSTIASAILVPILGVFTDRITRKRWLLGALAWIGAAFASLLFFAKDGNWQIGALGLFMGNVMIAASSMVNDAILPLISSEEERDRVSSRGWAWGYLGGGLLLAINLVLVMVKPFGLDEGTAVRVSMLSAAVWWAAFTFIPVLGLKDHPPAPLPEEYDVGRGLLAQSAGQLLKTVKELPKYPYALLFLAAFLFFNDGIQTVIATASTYGSEELGHPQSVLIATILMVQFVAFAGALVFGKFAIKYGAKRVILVGLAIWMVIVTAALVVPAKQVLPFLALGFGIGLVMGGTQALARSYFSLLIPRGKEAEYFSLYHLMERGTSWIGTFVFGLVYQMTNSYRPAVFALIAFFVVGGILLSMVDTKKGIQQAGNDVPSVI